MTSSRFSNKSVNKAPQNNSFVVKISLRGKSEKLTIIPIVATSITKKAVDRNRLKRQIRAITKEYFKKINQKNTTITIVAKKGTPTLSFEKMRSEIEDNLLRNIPS